MGVNGAALPGRPPAHAEPPARPPAFAGLVGLGGLHGCRPPDVDDRIRLADGRRVHVRPVRADDLEAEGRFVEALSPATRRLRFHGALNGLPDALLRAMTDVDPCLQVALVAVAGEALVADARYVVGDDPQVAEFAIAVADGWQGAGLGRALMQRLSTHARRRGLKRLHGEVLDDNHRMLSMLDTLGARLRPLRGGVGLVRAEFLLDDDGGFALLGDLGI